MKKKKAEKSIETVDVKNDDLMVSLGIRQPIYVEPDFTKDVKEKKQLKKVRTKKTKFYSVGTKPYHYIPLFDKLIVYTNRKGSQGTYSFKCNVSEVQGILTNLFADKSVIKYHWNGKTYYPNALSGRAQ